MKPRATSLALFLAVSVAGGIPSASSGAVAATADRAPDGRIAYGRHPDSNDRRDLFTVNADGTDVLQLTTSGTAGNPDWSPDGRRIAFDGGGGVSILDLTSGHVRRVSRIGSSPSWSPDGRRIAFARRDQYDDNDIGTVNVDGSGRRRITMSGDAYLPEWSPDGRRIMFQGEDGIWVMRPDGSDAFPAVRGSYGSWSPDGRRISFVRFFYEGSLDSYLGELFTIDIETKEIARLTRSASRHEGSSTWSPDGRWIAFSSCEWYFNCAIHVIPSDGGRVVDVTDREDDAEEYGAAWQPLPAAG